MHTLINRMQTHNFSHHRHGFRGTHVKSQAIVKGTLTVNDALPEHLAQGVFQKSGQTYPIAARYANEPTFLKPDTALGPRGCGIKVFQVNDLGPFLDPAGEETRTQDFTFNNAPVLELRDLPTTVEILTIRERNFDNPDKLEAEIKARSDKDLQLAPAQLPNHHFLGYTMYSQSAYRWGPYIAKYALFPVGKFQESLAEQYKITDESDPEQHSIWLRDYFREHDAEFDFRVQLCQNLDDQSVEDCGTEWDEEKYPFETVGRVKFPRGQDVWDQKRRAFWDDRMKLNVWYGLQAHQPLGSTNRMRRTLYRASVAKREEINDVKVVAIRSVDEIP